MADNVLCVRAKPELIAGFKARAAQLGLSHNDVLRFLALEFSQGRLDFKAVVSGNTSTTNPLKGVLE